MQRKQVAVAISLQYFSKLLRNAISHSLRLQPLFTQVLSGVLYRGVNHTEKRLRGNYHRRPLISAIRSNPRVVPQ